MINFGKSSIENCYFYNINILCYEPNTCKSIYLRDKVLSDTEAKNEFNICPKKADENIDDKNSYSFIIDVIILLCIVAILIGILYKYMSIKKSKTKKYNKMNLEDVKYISSSDDIGITNNNNNNENSENNINENNINENNSNENIINENIVNENNLNENNLNENNLNENNLNQNNLNQNNSSQNNLSQNNSNQNVIVNSNNINQNFIVNSNVFNSNALNNPQNLGCYVVLLPNNNQNRQNIPPSYDEINMILNANNNNDLLPEYTEVNLNNNL